MTHNVTPIRVLRIIKHSKPPCLNKSRQLNKSSHHHHKRHHFIIFILHSFIVNFFCKCGYQIFCKLIYWKAFVCMLLQIVGPDLVRFPNPLADRGDFFPWPYFCTIWIVFASWRVRELFLQVVATLLDHSFCVTENFCLQIVLAVCNCCAIISSCKLSYKIVVCANWWWWWFCW